MKLCLSGFLFEHAYQHCDVAFPDFVALAKCHGFDGVELRRTQVSVETPLDQVRAMRRVVEDHGLFVNCLESRGMPSEEPQRSVFVESLLERAALLNARMIKIGVPLPGDFTWFRRIADRAEEQGIRLGTNNHVGAMTETVIGAQQAFRAVNHRNYGLLFDCLHLWVCGENYVGAVARLAPHLINVLVHAVRPAREDDTVCVNREGRRFAATTIDDSESQNWQAIFTALRSVNFEGPITVNEHTEEESLRARIVETYPRLIRKWWAVAA